MKKFKSSTIIFLILAFLISIVSPAGTTIHAEDGQKNPIDSLLVYYGNPSSVAGTYGDIEGSAKVYASYEYVILGAGPEEEYHKDHLNIVQIITKAKEINPNVKFYGYVATGNREGIDPCITNDEFTLKTEKWKAVGVYGIFLDEFDYSYNLTRERQNDFITIAHSYDLKVIMNGYYLEDLFSTSNVINSVRKREFSVTDCKASGTYAMNTITVSDVSLFEVGDTIKLVDESGETIVDTDYYRKYFTIRKIDTKKNTITLNKYLNGSFENAVVYKGIEEQVRVKTQGNVNGETLYANTDDTYMFEDPYFDYIDGITYVKPPEQLNKIYDYYFKRNPDLDNKTYDEYYGLKTVVLNKIEMNQDKPEEYQEIVDLCNILSLGLNVDIYGIQAPSSQYPMSYNPNVLERFPDLKQYNKELLYDIIIDGNNYSNPFFNITWNVLGESQPYTKDSITISAHTQAEEEQKNPIDSMLVYYGYPSSVTGAKRDIEGSAELFASYEYVVLSAGVEEESHPDHLNTAQIIARAKEINPNIKFYGYISTGNREGLDACITKDECTIKTEKWKDIGAYGILLDELGYSHNLTRERQNDFIEIVHSYDLKVILNGYFIDELFSTTNITKNVRQREFSVTDSYASGTFAKKDIIVSDVSPFEVGDDIKLVDESGEVIADTNEYHKYFTIAKIDAENNTITLERRVNSSFENAVVYKAHDEQIKVKNEGNINGEKLNVNTDDIYMFEDPYFDYVDDTTYVNTPSQLNKIYDYYFRQNPDMDNQTYNEYYGLKTVALSKIEMNPDKPEEYQELVDLCNILSLGLNVDIYGIQVPSSQYPMNYNPTVLEQFPDLKQYNKELLYEVIIDGNTYSNPFFDIIWNNLDEAKPYTKDSIAISAH